MVIVLTNVVGRLDGKPYLSEANTFFDPVRGLVIYQIICKGMHKDRRAAAAFGASVFPVL